MSINEIILLSIADFVLLSISFYFFAMGFAAHRIYYNTLTRQSPEDFSREHPDLSGPQAEMDRIGCEWMQQHSDRKWDVHIQRDGYNLYGEYFDLGYDRAMLMLSGRTDSLRYGYYYAIPYAKAGYNILVIDQRAHGHSDGKYLTLGNEESKDALEWCRFLHDDLGNREILFHGLCIGAAGGMMAITADNCPDYVVGMVTEGMFTRFSESMKNHLIERKKNFWPLNGFINMWMRRACGYDMNYGPIDCIHKMNKPLLMLQSILDPYSTPENAVKLYRKCPSTQKQLVMFDGGGHSILRITDTETYDSAITAFIHRHFPVSEEKTIPCDTEQVCRALPQPPISAQEVVHNLTERYFPTAMTAAILGSVPSATAVLTELQEITLPLPEGVIKATLPFVAVAAVVFGDIALRGLNRVRDIAEPNELKGGGKYMTARILSLVGLLAGLSATAYWLVKLVIWLWPYISNIL